MAKKPREVKITADQAAERVLVKAYQAIESLIDSATNDLKFNSRVSRAEFEESYSGAVITEKPQNGDENFDGWLPIFANMRYFYQYTLQQLWMIRNASRDAVVSTSIGQNIQRHFVNNIIGDGLTYEIDKFDNLNDPVKLAASLKNPDPIAIELRDTWAEFIELNSFEARLPNSIERSMRDGECFWRLFPQGRDIPTLRFVDPYFITSTGTFQWGIIHEPNDIETVTGYNYNTYGLTYENQPSSKPADSKDKTIPVEEMVFIKRNTDFESPRGLPDYWCVLGDIRGVEKTRLNTRVQVQIQSSIAMVREFTTSTQQQVDALVNNNSDATQRRASQSLESGRSVAAKKFMPGTIVNGSKDVKHTFPSQNTDPSKFTAVAHDDLSSIASRFLLPVSWLLAADVTEMNAGAPTVRNFMSEQRFYYFHIIELFWKMQALRGFDMSKKKDYAIVITGPRLAFGKILDELRADQILIQMGCASSETISAKHGLNFVRERARTMEFASNLLPNEVMPGTLGNTNPNNDGVSTSENGKKGVKVADGSGNGN